MGCVRFGASEDLVLSWLPSVLKAFINDHPEIDLEFTIALSSTLIARHDAGDLDIVLCKRWPGDDRGEIVWRDEIVWLRQARMLPSRWPRAVDPLSAAQHHALDRACCTGSGRCRLRIACTSDTLSGVVAADASRRLGVMVLSRKLLRRPPLFEIKLSKSLPPLGSLDFILLRSARAPPRARRGALRRDRCKGYQF